MSSILNLNLLHLIRIYEFYYSEVCDFWKCLIQEGGASTDALKDR